MKKKVSGRHFSRTKNQRTALFRGLVGSLFEHGEILTTLAKAKAVKATAEKLTTKAIDGSVANQRLIFKFLNEKGLVNKLVKEIAPVFKERKGGYLKIVRLGSRQGDRAKMAKLMFVEKITRKLPKETVDTKPVKKEKQNDKTD